MVSRKQIEEFQENTWNTFKQIGRVKFEVNGCNTYRVSLDGNIIYLGWNVDTARETFNRATHL